MKKSTYNIGILGGGQLGKMLIEAAHGFEDGLRDKDDQTRIIRTVVWDPDPEACANEISDYYLTGSYNCDQTFKNFVNTVDVVLVEFENVPVKLVERIEKTGKTVSPSSDILEIVQDRTEEKKAFDEAGIPTTHWGEVRSEWDHTGIIRKLGLPFVFKTTHGGYDGKGQFWCYTWEQLLEAWEQLKGKRCIAEGFVDFSYEASITGARDQEGNMEVYDPSENLHRDGILRRSRVPADRLTENLANDMRFYLEILMEKMDLVGVLTVEFFVTRDGKLIANEMAARPHNSSHWTLDAAETSQFEQHVRAAIGFPLGLTTRTHDVIMENFIGEEPYRIDEGKGQEALIYNYGKDEVRPGRKMGHVNLLLRELKLL